MLGASFKHTHTHTYHALKLIDITFARSEKKIITKVAWKIFSDLIIFKLFDLIILLPGNKFKTMIEDTDKIYLHSDSYTNNI